MDVVETQTTSEGLTAEEAALLEQTLIEAHEGDNLLPKNSPSLLVDESTSRFSSAIWFEKIKEKEVILAGLGGIGSYVAFLLGRLKVGRLFLYDGDIVENTNLSGQLYSTSDIGISKTTCISRMLARYSEYYKIDAMGMNFTRDCSATKIMICGFDNMEARKTFFKKWVDYVHHLPQEQRSECLFIDGRLAAEEFQVFCIKGDCTYLIDKYYNTQLFTDDQAEETLCSYKQTSFCSNMIASVMINLFVNFVANECNPIIDRELPYFTYYNAETMTLNTKLV